MVQTDLIADDTLRTRMEEAFGRNLDAMDAVRDRAEALFPDANVIVWEGDAQTFQFSYVSEAAERILGYPRERWTNEATFWADVVVHPEDRTDAIAFCALATGRCRDHDFVYRAQAADGRTVVLHDVVRVIVGDRGVATTLRGIMIERPEEGARLSDQAEDGAERG